MAQLLIAALLTAVIARGAHAQDAATCTPPLSGPLEVFPASGSAGIPVDSPLRIRYSPGFFDGFIEPPGSLLTFNRVDVPQPVTGTATVIGDSLVFVPDSPLATGARYEGTATGIDGSLRFSFRTGTGTDLRAPTFSLGAGLETGSARLETRCDAPLGGYRVDVFFTPASDDSAPADVEYLVYLTRASELMAPELRGRVRNVGMTRLSTAFVLSPREAARAVCIEVLAVDPHGRSATSGERCVDPVPGTHFSGCGVSGSSATSGPERTVFLAVLIGGWALGSRWRRRRSVDA